MAENNWTAVADESELHEGVPQGVEVDGKKVLIVKLDGEIHACGGSCTHYGGPLADGVLRGREVTCPWHHARFDVTDGSATAPPALMGSGCYEVKVEGGTVYVGAKRKAEKAERTLLPDKTVAIVGAGAAGNACAETLRREGFAGKILLITAEDDRPYDRPNLSKAYLAGEADPSWMPLRSEKFYANRDIELLLSHRVTSLDPSARRIAFENGEEIAFDMALLATGGAPRQLPIPGTDLKNVFLLRSMADCERILKAAEKAKSAVVLGAGFIGTEVAASLKHRGMEEVHLVAPDKVPLVRVFGERIGKLLASMHEDAGVNLHFGTKPSEIRGTNSVEKVILEDGSELDADLVVIGIGVTPVVDYIQGADMLDEGAVPVDGRLQTRAEGVFAAGDIAVVPEVHTGEMRRIEHWTVAQRQGQHAARSMLGSDAPYDEVPFFWTRQFGKSIQYMGSARQPDRIVYRGTVEDADFLAGFYKEGRLKAIAVAGRSQEAIIAEQVLRAGKSPDPEALEDEDTDLKDFIG
jgi:NADPH-dependent 2,4-dienoyl-CoA reductase/sulfur reductase-like enzyme/nitrite reductase/ring-hydroxylating ferredoxin subunit